jgi:tetratricopeptide (TPR) repeat protein
VHFNRGEYAEALECYRESEAIARELGDRQSIGIAVGNRGNVHYNRGEYAEALECFRAAAAEHRDVGFRYGLTYWLVGAAGILLDVFESGGEAPSYLVGYGAVVDGDLWRSATLGQARELAGECVTISRELSKPDTLRSGRVALARIDAAEGRTDQAIATLGELLESSADDEQRAECHYWLWKIAGDSSARAEALRLYRTVIEKTPKHEYRRRVEELSDVTIASGDLPVG